MGALRDFVADLLESEGAAVDPIEPDGLDVLAPEPLREALGWPELTRLGFGTSLPPGATPIGFEGDWLDRFGALLDQRGRLAERQLGLPDHNAPLSDPERTIGRALDLRNAIWRLRHGQPAWTRCLLLAFRYTAVSDEKREGLIWLAFNQGTGACLDGGILESLRVSLATQACWRAPEADVRFAAGATWGETMLATRVPPLVEHKVREDLEPFLHATRRRLDRDRGRVHEYHADLRRAAQIKLAAVGSQSGDKAEADRKRETM